MALVHNNDANNTIMKLTNIERYYIGRRTFLQSLVQQMNENFFQANHYYFEEVDLDLINDIVLNLKEIN